MDTRSDLDSGVDADATQTIARVHSGPEARSHRGSGSFRSASSGASWSGIRKVPTPVDHDGPPAIGRFVILDQIASGGMGELYLGWDGQLDRKVAIKLVRTRHRSELTEERLRREAKVLAQLSHPNVVPVFDVGEFEGRVFLAMEFVEGRTLRTWARELELRGPARAAAIIGRYVEAGRGLEAVHAAGLAHRDFKPENVIVGGDDRVRIVDFGLARVLDEGEESSFEVGANAIESGGDSAPERRSEAGPELEESMLSTAPLTETGALLGTPRYMAPEQWQGRRGDSRSDQFSFCVALFEALYDARPFEAPNLEALAEVVKRGRVQPPPRRADVPARVRDALLRGLSAEPDARFESMTELLDRLEPRPLGKRPKLIVGALTSLVLLGLALASSTSLDDRGGSSPAGESPVASIRREFVAREHLDRVEAQIEVLEGAGKHAEADAAFAAFAGLPDHAGTVALGAGWLAQARRLERRGALEAELDAHAAAYLSNSAGIQRDALLGLAAAFMRTQQWQRLAGTLDALEAQGYALEPAQAGALRTMRVAALAAQRDLVGAAQVLEPICDATDEASASLRAAVRQLGRATVTEHLLVGANLQSFALPGVDLDGDGVGELPVIREGEPTIALLGTRDPTLPVLAQLEPELELGPPADLQVLRGAAEPLLGIRQGTRASLLRVLRSPNSVAPTLERVLGFDQAGTQLPWWSWVDLDGDGRREAYLGDKPGRRLHAFERDDDGAWRSGDPHLPTTAASSVIHVVADGDIDGDGSPELAVLAGEWSAYDLRILRPSAQAGDPPQLELAARTKLGAVHSLALIPAASGPGMWMAVGVGDVFASRRVFPADAPGGVPGLHLLAWDGEQIDPVATLDIPWPARILAGDFDGNGLADLALAISRSGQYETTIVLQTAPRRFEPLTITRLWPVGVVDRDGDGDDELLAIDADFERDTELPRGRLFVLGSGDERLPSNATEAGSPAAFPRIDAVAADAMLAGAIARAEDLVHIGLPLRGATQLRELARVAPPQLAARLYLRAAELFDARGHRREAAELYARAAADPRALGRENSFARLRAMQLYAEIHRFAEASYMAEAALDSLADPERRAEIEAEGARLRALAEPGATMVFDFEAPLDERWAVAPLAVRHRHGRLELELGGIEQGVIARRELDWPGGRLALEVEFELSLLEWGSELEVALVPIDPGATGDPLEVGVAAMGGGGIYSLRLACVAGGLREPGARDPEPPLPHAELPEDQRQFVLAAELVPELGRRWCRAEREGVSVEARRDGQLEPGRYELQIRGSNEWWSRGSASIDRITIVGARDPDQLARPITEAEALGRELAEGRAESVLDALTAADPGLAPRERALLRFLALDELGRWDAAELALADALELPRGREANDCRRSEHTRTLVGLLLRHRPERIGPVLRRLCRTNDYLAILYEVWNVAAFQHPESAAIERLLTTQTAGLERWQPLAADDRLAALMLLRLRAQAWSAQGVDSAARAELERAVELGDRWAAELDDVGDRAQFETELGRCRAGLAAELLDRGDEARALELLRVALERSPTPEILADVLTIDERFARIRDRSVWRELVEPARAGRLDR